MDGHDCAPTAFGGGNRSGPIDKAATLVAKGHKCDFEVETFVAHALRGEGFDASEDGTGRGTPIVPVQPSAFTFNTTQLTSPQNGQDLGPDKPCHSLAAKDHPPALAIAFTAKDHGGDAVEGISPTLRAGGHTGSHANAGVMPAIAFPAEMSATQCASTEELSPALSVTHTTAMASAWGVRRLTPTECERLQGFPDGWTAIPWGKKPAEACPDGPRYKGLGNSMAVPVMEWIGERIEAVRVAELNGAKE